MKWPTPAYSASCHARPFGHTMGLMPEEHPQREHKSAKARLDAEAFYATVGKVHCPAFNAAVHFKPEGCRHLVSSDGHLERAKESQELRFKLLPLAVKLVGMATTYQEYEQIIKGFEIKTGRGRVIKNKPVRYWGVIGIVEGRKIKVIIKKVGDNGPLLFWSVVPNWVTSWHRDIKLHSTMEGNPEVD